MPMKLVNELITLPPTYSLTQEASTFVAGLMLESQGIEAVTDAQSQQHAVAMGRAFRAHLAEVEATRKQLKEPILTAGRMLDSIAAEHCEPMVAELSRLELLVTTFQRQEQERVAEEQRRRQEEIDRLAKERLAAENALQDAPMSKCKGLSSLDKKHNFVFNHESKGLVCDHCNLTPDEAAALDDIDQANLEMAVDLAEQAERSAIVAPQPEPEKAKGMATTKVLKWECVDIHALYKARPDLCNPPTPKKSAINSTCSAPESATEASPDTTIPGLKLYWTDKTTIRK
jgi:hypothetical protein